MQGRTPGKVSLQKSWGMSGQPVIPEELLNTGRNSVAHAIAAGKLQAFHDLGYNAKAGAKQESEDFLLRFWDLWTFFPHCPFFPFKGFSFR